jgi:hypothetical protein
MPTFLTTVLHHPRSDHLQSISYLFLLEDPDQSMCPLEAADTLTVVVPTTVHLLLTLLDFLIEVFHYRAAIKVQLV